MFMSYDLTGRSASLDLQMTNTRDYLGYDLFDKLYTNNQDSLDPIIPKGTVYEKPSIVPVKPMNADSAYLRKANSVAFNTVDMPEAPDKNNGSNNWAVTGSKTKSGRPILSSDPHLGLNLPSLWYEMQITTPTHSTYGASFLDHLQSLLDLMIVWLGVSPMQVEMYLIIMKLNLKILLRMNIGLMVHGRKQPKEKK